MKRDESRDLELAERDQTIFEMRRRGWSFRRIAKAAGISKSQVQRVVKKRLDEVNESLMSDVLSVRAQQLVRLDALLDSAWEQVEDGHLGAISMVLKIEERRAKLLGLDAPQKREHTGAGGGPIKVENEGDLRKLSLEDLQRLAEIQAKMQGGDDEAPGPGEHQP